MASAQSVSTIFEAIMQRPADPGELLALLDDTATDAAIAARIAASAGALAAPASVIRIYEAVFGRKPDAEGLNYWVDRLTSEPGFDIYKMAQFLVASNEFNDRYGIIGLDETSARQALIEGLYKNVLGRAPDAEGLKFWLASDMSPAQMLVQFSESKEFVARAAPKIQEFFLDIAINGGTDSSRTDADDYTGSIFAQPTQPQSPQSVNSPATITGGSTGNVTEDGVKKPLDLGIVPGDAGAQPVFAVAAVPVLQKAIAPKGIGTEGQLKILDPDAGESVFRPVDAKALTTKYGVFTFDAKTGAWTFMLDNKAAQELKEAEKVEQKLTVVSLDGSASKDIVVTVHGTNDRADFGGKMDGAVTEDAAVRTASGNITVNDIDIGETGFKAVDADKLKATYGAFTFDAAKGDWTFTLDNVAAQKLKGAEAVQQTLTVTSLEGSTRDIVVTLTGENDKPTITGDITGAVTEDSETTTASGALKAEDADAGESGFVADANLTGTYGTFDFKADTGKWTYTINNAAAQALNSDVSATETLTVNAKDGAAQEIKVTINGVADAPTGITLVANIVEENQTGAEVGMLTTEDPDSRDTHTYTLSDDRFEVVAGKLKLKADQSLDFEQASSVDVKVTATDSRDKATDATFKIAVNNVNEAPTSISLAVSAIQENAKGATVGALATGDPDNGDSHTYTLSDNRFEVVNGSLKLKADDALDFEQASSVDVKVTATDTGNNTLEQIFTIGVTNVNEKPTDITLSASTVAENQKGATIGTLETIDPEVTDTHTYTVTDDRFEIVDGSLKLKSYSAFDFEQANSVNVTVTAKDQANNTFDKTFAITVTNDVSDDAFAGRPETITATGDFRDSDSQGDSEANFIQTSFENDKVYGGANNDTIDSGEGHDTIYGGSGHDSLDGGIDSDVLYGGSGNDTLNGGPDVDWLYGGYGADDLTGGGGSDVFWFSNTLDTNDTIQDFSRSDNDKIDLSVIDANTLAPRNSTFFFVANAQTTPKAGAHSVTWMVSGNDVLIFADTDGNTSSIEFMLKLMNVSSVAASDFTL